MAAATRARRRDSQARIQVLEASEEVSVGICGLPFWLAGEVATWRDLVVASRERLESDLKLEVHTRTRVTAIDARRKTVTAAHSRGDRKFEYDRLLVALGGVPRSGGLPGFTAPNVFTLGGLEDALKLQERLSLHPPRRAVVVGGGYLGIEMAEALVKRGAGVTVLEAGHSLMGLAASLNVALLERLERHVEVQCGAEVTALRGPGRAGDPVAEAVTRDGRAFAGDLFLVALGVEPNSALLRQAGARASAQGAITVDQRGQTSLSDVFAAGDCVQVQDRVDLRPRYIPLATTAARMGRVVGDNLGGRGARFGGALGTLAVKAFDQEIAHTGHAEGAFTEVETSDRSSYYPGVGSLRLRLFYDSRSGRVQGAQGLGPGAAHWINLVATAIEAEWTLQKLEELDCAYTPPLSPLWNPLYLASRRREANRCRL